ncbi:cytochrome b/b6 domain-containing protein [Thiothrix lacustris]|uniref:cytochrome b/b6 domain-containing protein n=1 Tax=Thiothrix lacustris TaxID=525917 RepID=UPI0027E464B7|nr:cytochrome b/b6 domain-containing protein [Thiothrix lacustris]WMP18743.1 cytochrome b/b6 domain-containing protein [Thiothrix lacustris]
MNDSNNGIVTTRQWHGVTRLLHGLMALGIVGQLVFSQLMVAPDELEEATALQKFALEGHELVGLGVVAVMVLHWLWMLFPKSDVSFGKLFPWGPSGLKRVFADVGHIFKRGHLPEVGNDAGLAGFIHGLGFLIATAMAASGFALYLVLDFGDGAGSDSFEQYAHWHGFFATFMWIYLAGHVIAAAWHEYRGQRLISGMFKL